jgi:hypothetical protein
MYVKE